MTKEIHYINNSKVFELIKRFIKQKFPFIEDIQVYDSNNFLYYIDVYIDTKKFIEITEVGLKQTAIDEFEHLKKPISCTDISAVFKVRKVVGDLLEKKIEQDLNELSRSKIFPAEIQIGNGKKFSVINFYCLPTL